MNIVYQASPGPFRLESNHGGEWVAEYAFYTEEAAIKRADSLANTFPESAFRIVYVEAGR